MYQICESHNFMWAIQNYLGQGATATVYQGKSKVNGDLVAVKCYKAQSECQFREFEVLRKVKHENIVKLIGIEESLADRKKVIVMELCNGGSLLDELMNPRNTNGLEEPHFLLVLKHIYQGMKYLRDFNIIHRDLKPGNIMKCIQDDGTIIYKLTDFGAARELTESETFQSIYGTEQYVHPDIYERGVLGRQTNKKFNSSVDLWSIGVTLYHIITGTLPFVAYKGKQNKQAMHYITTKKESGVISGIQTTENGPITCSRTLPDTCLLSEGLKKNITPIIAGLLEVDHSKIWGFETFFNKVDILLSHIIVNIFYVNKAKLIKIYLLPDQKYEDLEQRIMDETEIKGTDQILLYKSTSLKHCVQEFTRVCEYPKTSEDHPLFLFNKANDNFSVVPIQIPAWVDFPPNASVGNDIEPAHYACIIGHYCKHQIDKYSLYCKLINDSVESLIDYIDKDIKQMQLTSQHLFEKIRVYKKTAEVFMLKRNNCDNKLKNINKEFVTTTELVANLYNLQCFENTIKSEWDLAIKDLECPFKTNASARGKTQVEELQKRLQHLMKEPSTPNMSYNKSHWHILERKQIRKRLGNITTLLKKETFPQYQQIAKCFENWYKYAENIYFKVNVLKSEIEQSEQHLKDFENELTVDYDNCTANKDQLHENNSNAETVEKISGLTDHDNYAPNQDKSHKNNVNAEKVKKVNNGLTVDDDNHVPSKDQVYKNNVSAEKVKNVNGLTADYDKNVPSKEHVHKNNVSAEKVRNVNGLTADDKNVPSKDQVHKKNVNVEKAKKNKHCKLHLENYLKNKEHFNEILSENTRLMNQIQDFKYMKI